MTDRPLTCDAFDARLSDYLEGTLSAAEREMMDRHAAACARCAGLRGDLEEIRSEAAALPDLAPARDLWAGIAERIEPPVIALPTRETRPRRWSASWLAAAAAALVLATAGVTYTLTMHHLAHVEDGTQVAAVPARPDSGASTVHAPDSTPATTVSRPESTAGGGAKLAANPSTTRRARARVTYDQEIAQLERILRERRGDLDSGTVAVVERNLRIIDTAIEQSKAALAKDPKSRFLHQQLNEVLDQKVQLLKTVALLPTRT